MANAWRYPRIACVSHACHSVLPCQHPGFWLPTKKGVERCAVRGLRIYVRARGKLGRPQDCSAIIASALSQPGSARVDSSRLSCVRPCARASSAPLQFSAPSFLLLALPVRAQSPSLPLLVRENDLRPRMRMRAATLECSLALAVHCYDGRLRSASLAYKHPIHATYTTYTGR